MTAKKIVSVPELKKGDRVQFHGGVFLIQEDSRAIVHHMNEQNRERGGVDCHVARGFCLTGEVQGYFAPGREWTFQGNDLARVAVEVED